MLRAPLGPFLSLCRALARSGSFPSPSFPTFETLSYTIPEHPFPGGLFLSRGFGEIGDTGRIIGVRIASGSAFGGGVPFLSPLYTVTVAGPAEKTGGRRLSWMAGEEFRSRSAVVNSFGNGLRAWRI